MNTDHQTPLVCTDALNALYPGLGDFINDERAARARGERTMTHNLKTWPEPFAAVASGFKTFEVRKFDRDFRVGDTLILDEYDPTTGLFTTAEELTRYITYILPGGQFGIESGYCVLGLREGGTL